MPTCWKSGIRTQAEEKERTQRAQRLEKPEKRRAVIFFLRNVDIYPLFHRNRGKVLSRALHRIEAYQYIIDCAKKARALRKGN